MSLFKQEINETSSRWRGAPGEAAIPYEKQLDANAGWALTQGSIFFEGRGAVHDALRKITKRLDELGIAYSVVGGLALFHHGYRAFTDDVDILVTSEGLRQIHEKLDGLGYLPPHSTSKHLRNTELGVKVEFLVTGAYPGDGKPKPIAFPDPATVSVESEGIKYLNLNTLIELKLASGMTGGIDRLKDITGVVELIKALDLSLEMAEQLHPYVRQKYRDLWQGTRTRHEI